MDPQTLKGVLDTLWPELATLLGAAWSDLQPELEQQRKALVGGGEGASIAQARILYLLADHPSAFEQLLALAVDSGGHETRSQGTRYANPNDALSGEVMRYTDIACPARVWLETPRIAVVVRLTLKRPAASATVEELTGLVEAPVQVQLRAPGFETLNAERQETPILADTDSPPLVFDLKPSVVGHTRLELDFFQNGQPLRTATVPVEITAHEVAEEVTTHAMPGAPWSTATPPDLVLHVAWNETARQLEYSLIRAGGAWWRSFSPVQLASPPATQAAELYRRITSLAQMEDPTLQAQFGEHRVIPRDQVDLQIKQLGYDLWSTLLPAELRRFYATEREHWRDRSLLIYSDEPHLPWELVWPYDDVDGAWADDGPWSITTKLTRWLRRDDQGNGNEAAPGQLSLRAPAVLAPSYHRLTNLPLTVVEQATLRALLSQHGITDVGPSVSNWGQVMAFLQGSDYDWFHVAAHGSFYPTAPDSDSAIWLEGDRALTPQNLRGPEIVRHFKTRRPAFVFNACEVGRQAWALTRIGGWANHLVSLHAGLFVAPLWIVNDKSAAGFAAEFYRGLLAGKTLGEAVRAARYVAREEGDPSWLAYSIYGHPNAVLTS